MIEAKPTKILHEKWNLVFTFIWLHLFRKKCNSNYEKNRRAYAYEKWWSKFIARNGFLSAVLLWRKDLLQFQMVITAFFVIWMIVIFRVLQDTIFYLKNKDSIYWTYNEASICWKKDSVVWCQRKLVSVVSKDYDLRPYHTTKTHKLPARSARSGHIIHSMKPSLTVENYGVICYHIWYVEFYVIWYGKTASLLTMIICFIENM